MFWERNICLFVLLFLVHAHTTYCYTRTKIHKLSKNTRKGKWHIIQTLVLLFGFFLSVKHGAVWMYQNSWLSFYSAVFNLAQWFRLLIVPHRNTILSSVTPVTWKEEHRTFHSVQTFQQLYSSCSSFSRTAFRHSLITFSYCGSINSRKKR